MAENVWLYCGEQVQCASVRVFLFLFLFLFLRSANWYKVRFAHTSNGKCSWLVHQANEENMAGGQIDEYE